MTGWVIAGFVWAWLWGAVLSVCAVQQQKGRKPLNGWDWAVCVLWFLSTPLVILILMFERKSHG